MALRNIVKSLLPGHVLRGIVDSHRGHRAILVTPVHEGGQTLGHDRAKRGRSGLSPSRSSERGGDLLAGTYEEKVHQIGGLAVFERLGRRSIRTPRKSGDNRG